MKTFEEYCKTADAIIGGTFSTFTTKQKEEAYKIYCDLQKEVEEIEHNR